MTCDTYCSSSIIMLQKSYQRVALNVYRCTSTILFYKIVSNMSRVKCSKFSWISNFFNEFCYGKNCLFWWCWWFLYSIFSIVFQRIEIRTILKAFVIHTCNILFKIQIIKNLRWHFMFTNHFAMTSYSTAEFNLLHIM